MMQSSKNETLGRQLLNKGFFLSFGEAILKQNSGAAKLIKEIDFFFLETDGSQSSIEEIYQAVAEIKNIPVDELKQIIFANWERLKLV
ncbi:MAG: hypothetical protein EOO96_23965 [Pedobacter sp.]|nr:MAG: hypothetical protein EOO96_23965 [Pedobacter sp.]